MKKLHLKRLLKLSDHLIDGKLAHEKFDFGEYSSAFEYEDEDEILKELKCGTSGCAIGECPQLFPKYWEWVRETIQFMPKLKDSKCDEMESGMKFFSINEREYRHLFLPVDQSPGEFGGEQLGFSATKEQVASNIEIFVERKAKELNIKLN